MAMARPHFAWWNRKNGILLGAGLAVAVIGGLIGGLIVNATGSGGSGSGGVSRAIATTECPAITVANTVGPTVVTIHVVSGSSASNGSGSVIRDDGYILTNDHVIASGAENGSISVLFSDGETEPAKVVGRSTPLDLAVLKVDTGKKLPTIVIGSSETVQVGQPVVALGAPLGLAGTVTRGIVSALGREINLPAANDTTAQIPGAIQTDASINPGNSGGALVDCAGRQVGVNTAISTVPNAAGQPGGGSVGIGFAIPMDLARIVADQLIEHGQFSPPYFGASTIPISAAVAKQFDAPAGLYVAAVSAGGPAAKAGLMIGDVITEVDGKAATGPDSVYLATLTKKPGDQVRITYVRERKSAQTTVTLAAQP
jgi:putative serine protease PepD